MSQDIKRVKLSDYELQRTIGKGSFGRVRLAREKNTNRFVACKMLEKNEVIRYQQVDHL